MDTMSSELDIVVVDDPAAEMSATTDDQLDNSSREKQADVASHPDEATDTTKSEESEEKTDPNPNPVPRRCWQAVTVEPVLFIMSVMTGFASPTYPALLYDKVCLSLYTADICSTITTNASDAFKPYKDELQRQTSRIQFYDYLFYTLPIFVTIFFLGSWSDRFNRKIPMISGCAGAFLAYFTYAMLSIDIASPVYFCFIGTFCYGFCGGFEVLLMGCYSYLSDTIPEEHRTKRLSFLGATHTIALVIPLLASGIIVENTSYLFIFSFVSVLVVLATLYAIFCVPSVKPNNRKPQEAEDSTVETAFKDLSWKDKAASLFSLTQLYEAFVTTTKKRGGQTRKHILLILLANFTTSASSAGIVMFLFLRAPPLNFTQPLYTLFLAVNSSLSFCTQTLLLPMLQKYLHMGDVSLALCGAAGETFSRFHTAICRTEWLIWLVPFTTSVSTFQTTGSKSYLAALVPANELGKIYAVQSFLDNLALIVAPTIYSLGIYPASVAFYPGLSFLVSGVLCIFPMSLYVYLFIKRDLTPLEEETD